MKKFLLSFAPIALAAIGYFATAEESSASCSGPCAPITIVCNGMTLRGPAAQANLLAQQCGGGSYQAPPKQAYQPRPERPTVQREYAPRPTVTTTIKQTTTVRPPAMGGNWTKPNPGRCAVGQPAPAYQDSALAALNLTFTCDSQPGTGGWNLKALGSSTPVFINRCVPRLYGQGYTFACKINVNGYRLEGGSLILNTNKGYYSVSKGSFGGYSVRKI